MTRTVNIEVYCDTPEGDREVFAVVSEHRSDLPKPFNAQVQAWAQAEFDQLSVGERVPQAGELEYEPNGAIVEIRRYESSTDVKSQ